MDPRLHDSHLEGIKIISFPNEGRDRNIQLLFRSAGGQSFEVVLESVRDLRCDNFRQGNIVFELIEVPPADVSQQEIEHLNQVSPGGGKEETQRTYKLLESGEYKFIRLESSYGADLWALCKSVEIIESES